ncbi:tetratricopeptide repeat protein [Paracrocinitomix mangrovi]|uniref:tetratricopeptide repeat protein n=1 Tax=Paracrocinitomix mangrovi TaxID=2862509 RepID=UPI001C8D6387|nr:tetratricopeptide repeat protein [Paracrocinitomix mangrovi]UKN01309.1 tetratricopeptide repeat protein [Paracrocinitomix mangrovi]
MKWFVLHIALFLSLISIGQENVLSEGNELYNSEKYEEAIEAYSKHIANGEYSVELYYNLGNAYYRNGDLGKSIWAYESALKIDPDHEDANFNLEFANAQTIDKLDTQRHGLGHWVQGLAFSDKINFWAIISIICSILLSLALTVFVKSRLRKYRNFSLLSTSILLIGLIVSIVGASYHKNLITSKSQGVVITEQVDVLVSPQEGAKTSYKLSEGAKVSIVSDSDDWVQINLNDNKGWIQKKDIWNI